MTPSDTWGYSGNVGEWTWEVELPRPTSSQERHHVFRGLIARVLIAIQEQHRFRHAEMDVEYPPTATGDDFTEDLDVSGRDADEVLRWIDVRLAEFRDGIVTRLQATLDTRVLLDSGPKWIPESAGIHVGAGPLLDHDDATTIAVTYSTYIDVWLSPTLGPERTLRDNTGLAQRNATTLQRILVSIGDAVRSPIASTDSHHYRNRVGPQGFTDAC